MAAELYIDFTGECKVLLEHSICYERKYYLIIVLEDSRAQYICVPDLCCVYRSMSRVKSIDSMTACGVPYDLAEMIFDYVSSTLGLLR